MLVCTIFYSMDGIITFCPESISISDVQTRINNAVASKVDVSDVQRIVNTSLVDNSWPKTRSFSGSAQDQYITLPTNTGSVTVIAVSKWTLYSVDKSRNWDLPQSLAKGKTYFIGSIDQGSTTTHNAAIMFTGDQLRIWDSVSGGGSKFSVAYDITVSLTA